MGTAPLLRIGGAIILMDARESLLDAVTDRRSEEWDIPALMPEGFASLLVSLDSDFQLRRKFHL